MKSRDALLLYAAIGGLVYWWWWRNPSSAPAAAPGSPPAPGSIWDTLSKDVGSIFSGGVPVLNTSPAMGFTGAPSTLYTGAPLTFAQYVAGHLPTSLAAGDSPANHPSLPIPVDDVTGESYAWLQNADGSWYLASPLAQATAGG